MALEGAKPAEKTKPENEAEPQVKERQENTVRDGDASTASALRDAIKSEDSSKERSDSTAQSKLAELKPSDLQKLLHGEKIEHVRITPAAEKIGRMAHQQLEEKSEHRQDAHRELIAPADSKEKEFLDLVYKALRNTPGHGADLEKNYSPLSLSVLKNIPFYNFDKIEKLSPESRESHSAVEVLRGLKSFEELSAFVRELKKQKLESTGQPLSEKDLKYIHPLSDKERKDLSRYQNFVDKTKSELDSTGRARAANGIGSIEAKDLEYLQSLQDKEIQEKLRKREGHFMHGMLSALMADKPGLKEYEKMASYALLTDWNNHNHGMHLEKSKLLEGIFKQAEKDLNPDELKAFQSKAANFARAVIVHEAIENRAMHGIGWHSPDAITVRSVLAPLDGENRKQVMESLVEITEGQIQHDLEKRVRNMQEFFAIDELLNRKGEVDVSGQVMVGLRYLKRRFGLEINDFVSGPEWAAIQNGETGVIKRAALMDAAAWKKLEDDYARENGSSLKDLPNVKGMPKSFAGFFAALHEARGDAPGYDTIKKIIDSATAERRYDHVTLALQIASEETRKSLMNDAEQNVYKKSTMDHALEVFGERHWSEFRDVNQITLSGKTRTQTLKEFFQDGEVSLLTKVNLYTGGILQLNRLPYTREHEAQMLSSDTDGIKSFFLSATDKQKEKVNTDSSYRNELTEALQKAMSKREAAILIADLRANESVTSNLLSLRPPGWFSKTDEKDLRYRRFFEEHLSENDLEYWKKNYRNTDEINRFKADIASSYTASEVDTIMKIMNEKFSDPEMTIEKINREGIGNRSLESEISDAATPADLVRALVKINHKTRSELLASSREDQKVVDLRLLIEKRSKELTNSDQQAAALKDFSIGQLDKITASKSSPDLASELELDSIALVKLSAAVNMKDPFVPLNAIQAAFDKIPDLKDKLQADPALKGHFEQALRMAIHMGNVGTLFEKTPYRIDGESRFVGVANLATQSINTLNAYREGKAKESFARFEHLLRGEPLKIEELTEFASGWPAKREVVFSHATSDEVKRLIEKTDDPETVAWQRKVLGPIQHREVTLSCLEKGACDAADQARIASLSHKNFSENKIENTFMGVQRNLGSIFTPNLPTAPAIEAFQKLERAKVQDMVASGFSKYQSLGSLDLLERSSIAEKLHAQMAMTQGAVGPMETTLAAFAKRDSIRSPRWQMATDLLTGGKAGIEVENANNALLKAMLELKDPQKGIIKDLQEMLSNPEAPAELVSQVRESLANFEKTLQNYTRAEEGIADRTKALANLLNCATVLIGYGVVAKLTYGSLYGGAYFGDSLFIGKLQAKLQMGLSYWITSEALRENMDVEAAIKALVVLPFFQAKLPVTFGWGAGQMMGMPMKHLGHGPLYKFVHYGLDKGVKGGIVIGTPAALYYNNPFSSGVRPGAQGFSKPEDRPSLRLEAKKNNLDVEMMTRILDLGVQKK